MYRISPVFLTKKLTVKQINALSKESFYYFFEDIIIATPGYFHQVWAKLPCISMNQMIDVFVSEVGNLNDYDKLIMLHSYDEVMRCHLKIFEEHVRELNETKKHNAETERNTFSDFIDLMGKYTEKFEFPLIFYPGDYYCSSFLSDIEHRLNNSKMIEFNHAINIIKLFVVEELKHHIV